MRRAVLEAMTSEELGQYAEAVGAKVDGLDVDSAKVDAILARVNRTESVTVAGLTIDVNMAKLNDLRLAELQAKDDKTISDLVEMADCLFGEAQVERIKEHVADDDGHVDAVLFAFVIGKAFEAASEKN